LQYIKGRNEETSNKLRVLVSEINKIINDISPTISIRVGSSTEKTEGIARSKQIMEEVMNALQSGTHITMEFLKTTYPEDESRWHNTLHRLEKMPNVVKVKDGSKVRYFMK
jgi:hypothetical protein